MLHHLSLPVSNLVASKALYDAALQALGYRCVSSSEDFAGYGVEDDKDKLALKQVERAECAGRGFHIGLRAPDRLAVDRFYAALAHGAIDCGAQGLRAHYGPHYYAAFVEDLDGHRIEAVINTAPSAE